MAGFPGQSNQRIQQMAGFPTFDSLTFAQARVEDFRAYLELW